MLWEKGGQEETCVKFSEAKGNCKANLVKIYLLDKWIINQKIWPLHTTVKKKKRDMYWLRTFAWLFIYSSDTHMTFAFKIFNLIVLITFAYFSKS